MKPTLQLLALLTCAVCFSIASTPAARAHGDHSKTAKPKTYRNVRGQIGAVLKPQKVGSKTAVTLDHENIPNFMRAMRMTMPLQNPADAKKLKQGTKIRFDMVLKDGNFFMANIKILPPKTKLNLAAN